MDQEAAAIGGGVVPLVSTLCVLAAARAAAGPRDGVLGGLVKVIAWCLGWSLHLTYSLLAGYLLHLLLRMPGETLFAMATWWFFKPVFDEALVLVDRVCWAFYYLCVCPSCPVSSAPSTRTTLFPTPVYWDYPTDDQCRTG